MEFKEIIKQLMPGPVDWDEMRNEIDLNTRLSMRKVPNLQEETEVCWKEGIYDVYPHHRDKNNNQDEEKHGFQFVDMEITTGLSKPDLIKFLENSKIHMLKTLYGRHLKFEARFNEMDQHVDLFRCMIARQLVKDERSEIDLSRLHALGIEADEGDEMIIPLLTQNMEEVSRIHRNLEEVTVHRTFSQNSEKLPKIKQAHVLYLRALRIRLWLKFLQSEYEKQSVDIYSHFYDEFIEDSVEDELLLASRTLAFFAWATEEPRLLCIGGKMLFYANKIEHSLQHYIHAMILCEKNNWFSSSALIAKNLVELSGDLEERPDISSAVISQLKSLRESLPARLSRAESIEDPPLWEQ